jgi:hypothetical protein
MPTKTRRRSRIPLASSNMYRLAIGLVRLSVVIASAVAALGSARLPPLILGIALSAGALLWLCALADVPLELPERLS